MPMQVQVCNVMREVYFGNLAAELVDAEVGVGWSVSISLFVFIQWMLMCAIDNEISWFGLVD